MSLTRVGRIKTNFLKEIKHKHLYRQTFSRQGDTGNLRVLEQIEKVL